MPVVKSDKIRFAYSPVQVQKITSSSTSNIAKARTSEIAIVPLMAQPSGTVELKTVKYPLSDEERSSFRTKNGKRLTPHQWAVYDFTLTVPTGKVTTYKDVSSVVGGSPRSVGNALRNNPFCPYVPCHRVIASNLFIGGFLGEWGKSDKTGTRCLEKIGLLQDEGVPFDNKGVLVDPKSSLWRP